jgi:putative ABC transport system permease protein
VKLNASNERVRWRALFTSVLRESRASRGRLLFFTACLAIGVAAVVGVTALISAMEAGLREGSRELLAGDLSVSARRALPEEAMAEYFAALPHDRADVLELSAMAARDAEQGSESRLVELKVVSAG